MNQFLAGVIATLAVSTFPAIGVVEKLTSQGSTYSVRVLDTNFTGQRRVMVVSGGDPVMFQYGKRFQGTNDFCVIRKLPTTPETCFRSNADFDAASTDVQRLKFKSMTF